MYYLEFMSVQEIQANGHNTSSCVLPPLCLPVFSNYSAPFLPPSTYDFYPPFTFSTDVLMHEKIIHITYVIPMFFPPFITCPCSAHHVCIETYLYICVDTDRSFFMYMCAYIHTRLFIASPLPPPFPP